MQPVLKSAEEDNSHEKNSRAASWNFISTAHEPPLGIAAGVRVFPTKPKALARKIPLAT